MSIFVLSFFGALGALFFGYKQLFWLLAAVGVLDALSSVRWITTRMVYGHLMEAYGEARARATITQVLPHPYKMVFSPKYWLLWTPRHWLAWLARREAHGRTAS